MKKEKTICNDCGFPRIIVNKKYGLCNACNSTRIKKQREQKSDIPEKFKERPIIPADAFKKRKPIAKKSAKRIADERKYVETRERKREFQKEKGIYRCFFCNAPLEDSEESGNADCHHVLGRDGDLYAEWSNLFFSHRDCHNNYHDWPVERLMKTKWYLKFIDRLEKYNREAYNQELRRLNKASVIDDSQFLKMFKPEKVD